jgi:hypothetical protein
VFYCQDIHCQYIIVLYIISTDEDPGLRIESFAVINLRVSTNKTIIYLIAMQTYKELIVNIIIYSMKVLGSLIVLIS